MITYGNTTYFIDNYDMRDLDIDYFNTKINNFDSLTEEEKIEFFHNLLTYSGTSIISGLSLQNKIALLKKIIFHQKLISHANIVMIFENIIDFHSKAKDSNIHLEIASAISPEDEDRIINLLSSDDYSRTYNKSSPAFEKLIMFSILGPKVSAYIENRITTELESWHNVVIKPRGLGPSNFMPETWKRIALKFALFSPYANIRNIMISLYKMDKDFVKQKFIPLLPDCDKYKVLL